MVMLKLSLGKPFGRIMEILQIIAHVRRSWQRNGDGNVIQTCMAVVICPPWYLIFVRSSLLVLGKISDQGAVFLAAETDEVMNWKLRLDLSSVRCFMLVRERKRRNFEQVGVRYKS